MKETMLEMRRRASQTGLHLIHNASGLLVLILVVYAAHAAHLVAIVGIVAGIVDVLLGGVFGDVLCVASAK
jgi:hypothetical protein